MKDIMAQNLPDVGKKNNFLSNWSEEIVLGLISSYVEDAGGVLTALQKVQEEFGCISEESKIVVAKSFNLTRAEVHGIVSFYHDFSETKRGDFVVKICQAEACQAMGSRELTSYAKVKLALEFHQVSSDGLFSLEPVYCLGNCARAPAVMINNVGVGDVDSIKLTELFAVCKALK
ncbi:MAG: hypothetical protein CMM25_00640 [Rhodospirillaceae bacterium]|nr:hypothetical protein [Rhodospirillaceae bacterium]